jgi:anti-sigma factor RsiW
MSTYHPAELQLLDYVEGSLAGEELKGLRRHVTQCSACQETLRELTHAVDVLDRLPTVDIPHDGVRRQARRNRRRLLTRALPIVAIVLAAGAVVQELRPAASSSGDRTTALATGRPALTSVSLVTRVPETRSDRAGIAARLTGFDVYIPPDHGSLVALVDLDDLAAAETKLQQSHEGRLVTVLLIGVQGLDGTLEREHLQPGGVSQS